MEGIDNEGDVLSLSYAENGESIAEKFEPELLGGTIRLKVDGYKTTEIQSLYTYEKHKPEPYTITAVPYYTWGNRGLGQMRVWLPERS